MAVASGLREVLVPALVALAQLVYLPLLAVAFSSYDHRNIYIYIYINIGTHRKI